MKIKVFIARWMAQRIRNRARIERRELRNFQRGELSRIRRLEKRSRGLRLYAGWSACQANGTKSELPERYSAFLPAT